MEKMRKTNENSGALYIGKTDLEDIGVKPGDLVTVQTVGCMGTRGILIRRKKKYAE